MSLPYLRFPYPIHMFVSQHLSHVEFSNPCHLPNSYAPATCRYVTYLSHVGISYLCYMSTSNTSVSCRYPNTCLMSNSHILVTCRIPIPLQHVDTSHSCLMSVSHTPVTRRFSILQSHVDNPYLYHTRIFHSLITCRIPIPPVTSISRTLSYIYFLIRTSMWRRWHFTGQKTKVLFTSLLKTLISSE
jgi:hypothetical protein